MQYNSTLQYQYQQQYPRFVCRNASRFHEISQLKGFTCKCRNPRCSLACHQNWARKQSAIIARHLHDLPPEMTCYRGNLTMPKDASPADHRRVRASFLLALKRWKVRHGIRAEIHATTHATSPINAHYDFVAFSDTNEFRSKLRETWVKAGGHRATCVPLKEDEKDATAKYLFKRSSNKEDKETDTIGTPKLLQSRQLSGLDTTWHTRRSKSSEGFWRGTTADQIWKTLCFEWFASSNKEDKETDTINIKKPYIPGNDKDKDIRMVARKLPTNPVDAVPLWALTKQWGLDSQPATLSDHALFSKEYYDAMPKWGEGYMARLLDAIPNAIENKGLWHIHLSEV